MSGLKTKRGDTLIELVFGFAIFSTVTAFTIAIMNSSLTSAEGSLELTLARNEIDAQAAALRFVHNSFLNDRNYGEADQPYRNLWITIRSLATSDTSRIPRLADTAESCESIFDYTSDLNMNSVYNIATVSDPNARAFVLNTRKIERADDYSNTVITAEGQSGGPGLFYSANLNPRVIYTNGSDTTDDSLTGDELDDLTAPYNIVARVEGIWDVAVKESGEADGLSRFYDFHIYTCWSPPGAKRPTTIGTIIRLYNPEYIEESYF